MQKHRIFILLVVRIAKLFHA